jgi:hypothetical protein
MLRNPELAKHLISQIESGEISTVINLLRSEPLKFGDERADWFYAHYKNSTNPESWLNVWEKILVTEWTETRQKLMKDTINDIIDKAVRYKDHALLIKAINTPEYQSIALSILFKDQENIEFSLDLLSKIQSPEQKLVIYEHLIKLSCEKYNAPLLQKLKGFPDPFNFDKCVDKIQFNEKDQIKLNKLLVMSPDKGRYVFEKMAAFVNGYGNIQQSDALLTLAQVRDRKKHKYDYEPILLYVDKKKIPPKNDFLEFIKILNAAQKPIVKQFICYLGKHYVSGEITIAENGQAKIWMLDSLGANATSKFSTTCCHDECLQEFASVFPHHEIFISQEIRQNTEKGCSVYALDDSAHLPQLHLGDQYSEKGIWGYLDDAATKPTAKITQLKGTPPVTVTICDTPLSLMRTMQSEDLLQITDPSKGDPRRSKEEQELIINKKGETAYTSALKKFRENPRSGKNQNTRLDYKFEKMRDANWEFLANHTPEELEKEMIFFNVDAFRARTEPQLFGSDCVQAMEEALKACRKSWASTGKEIKLTQLETALKNYKESYDENHLFEFIINSSNPRDALIREATVGNTASTTKFYHALSEDSKKFLQARLDNKLPQIDHKSTIADFKSFKQQIAFLKQNETGNKYETQSQNSISSL